MSENKITFPVKLASNNPQSFGIVDAIEVSGHRMVDTISDLYAISDPVLSVLKDGSDAIGQEWFVVSEDCKYRLDNWANRKSSSGWTKLPKQELINTKQSVSEKDQPGGYAGLDSNGKLPEKDQPGGYAGLDSNGKLPIEKTYGDTATVTEVETYESLPVTGLSGVIYYVSNTSAQYKWSGSSYVDITDGADNAKKNETSIFDCSNGTSTKYYASLSAAINVVPPVYRTSNRIISYLSTENATTTAVNYQYHGIDSTTWTDLTKWEHIPNQADLAEIRSDLSEATDKLTELEEKVDETILLTENNLSGGSISYYCTVQNGKKYRLSVSLQQISHEIQFFAYHNDTEIISSPVIYDTDTCHFDFTASGYINKIGVYSTGGSGTLTLSELGRLEKIENKVEGVEKDIRFIDCNKSLTKDFCSFSGYIYSADNGTITKSETSDINILNSDFIPIEIVQYVECNGSPRTGSIAIAAFTTKDDLSSCVWLSNGDIPTSDPDWFTFADGLTNIGIPSSAKYIIIQVNKNSALSTDDFCIWIRRDYKSIEKNVSVLNDTLQMSHSQERVATVDFLQFSGKLLKVINGVFTRTITPDTNILNSDFIPILNLLSVGVNGAEYYGNIAIAFFSDKNDASFIDANYGNEFISGSNEWYYTQSSVDDLYIPPGTKYVILQVNKDSSLNAGELYCDIINNESERLNAIEQSMANSYIYNVKSYGALGDGIHDDTTAIQSALDACYAGGGGEVFFPNGIYNLASVSTRNGQTNHLFIPMSANIATAKQIRLVGESVCTYKMYTPFSGADGNRPTLYGSVLKSTYLPDALKLSTPIAIIGSESNSGYITGSNETRVVIENLSMVTTLCSAGYPLLSGINAIRLAHIHLYHCMITSDSAAPELQAPPSDHVSFGFAGCNNYCDPPQAIEDTNICGGFQHGLIACEHLYGKGIDIQTCINAFTFGFAYHPNYFSLVSAHNCKNIVSALASPIDSLRVGISIVKFECLDIECNKGMTPTGFNFEYGVNDPNNHLVGSLEYLMVQSGSQAQPEGLHNNHWQVNGGTGIDVTTLNP